MAVYITVDNKLKVVSREKAKEMLKILNGEKEPTPEQEAFLLTVKRVYLPNELTQQV